MELTPLSSDWVRDYLERSDWEDWLRKQSEDPLSFLMDGTTKLPEAIIESRTF